MTVRAPGCTLEEMEGFQDKLLGNSGAASVIRSSNTSAVIAENDIVEPNEVLAKIELPSGAIGDYAFYDRNSNGIQDEGDEPASGILVTLWKTTVTRKAGELDIERKEAGRTETDQDGYYLFDGLNCNFLKAGRTEDSTEPDDYVGGAYYRYQVTFSIPADYGVTDQYVGEDRALDSNINKAGETEVVSLAVQTDENSRLTGERNMTLDAGYINSYRLGNKVWIDDNRNGLQDDEEAGVNGVPVYLYRVDGPDGTVSENQEWYRRTETANVDGEDGVYWFEGLPRGWYVVEFDISGIRKEDGYTPRYAFTRPSETAGADWDSDAKYTAGEHDRIRRTDPVLIASENPSDPTWDAGLIYYSAIGGFCFDDKDYDDLQSLMIPLPGTKVFLYEVENGIRKDTPLRSTVVGADGMYFFDQLLEGDYQLYFQYPEGYEGVEGNVGNDDTRDSDVYIFDDETLNAGYTEIIHLPADTVDRTWDAGARLYSSIGDYVWVDADHNGLQDAGETPVAGVRVVLQMRSGIDGPWEYYGETVTDQNGLYRFDHIRSSQYIDQQYRVVFAPGMNAVMTTLNSGNDTGRDSDALPYYINGILPVTEEYPNGGGYITTSIKPGYGQSDMTWDAGIYYSSASLGDYVWYDDNRNGLQDPEETGVPGVKVILEYTKGEPDEESGWAVYGEQFTDQNGYYRFDDLSEGYYRVRFELPDGYTAAPYNMGTSAKLDSDASRKGEGRWYYSRSFWLADGTIDLTWDAGIYKMTIWDQVKTGDNSWMLVWGALLILSGLGILLAVSKLFRSRKFKK